MDVEKSSLCNCVVNFLLEEKYLLTAFELLHELLEDGRHDQAIRLREFFADRNLFPADQIAKYNSLRVADPQSLLQEKETIEEKLAISEYELRLALEDLSRLKTELQKQKESSINGDDGPHQNINASEDSESQQDKRNSQLSSLGSLKDAERKDINCAIKEYLLFAGYRLTAMTFIEEVTDQNLDVWAKSPACVSDALRRYYYQYLSATNEAAEEKLSILRENESLAKENERLNQENETLLKNKESVDNRIIVLTKSLESAQKDLKDREITIQGLRQSLDAQRKELNECRAEITSLKMHIEGTRASRQSPQVGNNLNEVKYTHNDAEVANGMDSTAQSSETKTSLSEDMLPMEKVVKMNEEKTDPDSIDPTSTSTSNATELPTVLHDENVNVEQKAGARDRLSNPHLEDVGLSHKSESPKRDTAIEKMLVGEYLLASCTINPNTYPALFDTNTISLLQISLQECYSVYQALETIQTLSDALPKIVPYVLINHREELLPLIMCAIERHPDSSVRDSLTHTLFNLIKRPDEQQRRIIMDACVTLAKNVGEMRTETELLPQCWEQINHTYEERRLLVAQSCGELAEFVRPEIRDSLILSIVQQLIEDPATVVREAAAHNVALLLPLFPNRDKYFKVEELMFQLVCDPSGLVVETTLKELVPAVITWGGKLDHILRILMSHILSSAQRCPPLSGVEGSVESHFRVLGERERWNVDVLLRMLMELLPFIHRKCIETCPFTSAIESLTSPEQANSFFSTALLRLYAGGHMDWPAFDWMYVDCFPDLIQFSCLLPQKEDTLRSRITKFLLDVHKRFGDDYLEHVMLPVFLVAVGDCDSADLKFFPPSIHSRVKGLRPKTAVAEKLAIMCVLPLLLSGVLGACASDEHLSRYLRKLLVQNAISEDSWSGYRVAEVIDAIRFVCTFEEHHGVVFNILWEMVVSSNTDMKTEAANLLKVLVPYIDVKVASTQVLPALVTLGSDQNLNVKYASIDAFGAVAQHFKNDMIVDKIHIQMDAFLEDGSHEATIAVIRALVGAVPHTTERLREYLLSKISSLTALPAQGTDITRRREKADVFCEAVRALDATDLPSTSTRDLLITSIQNLLKDPDSLDPAHKEALEIILKERSGGAFESISKAMGMGAHLGIATSVTSFFGEGRGKKNSGDQQQFEAITSPPPPSPLVQQDGTRFQRMMRGGFTDILRGKGKGTDDSST